MYSIGNYNLVCYLFYKRVIFYSRVATMYSEAILER